MWCYLLSSRLLPSLVTSCFKGGLAATVGSEAKRAAYPIAREEMLASLSRLSSLEFGRGFLSLSQHEPSLVIDFFSLRSLESMQQLGLVNGLWLVKMRGVLALPLVAENRMRAQQGCVLVVAAIEAAVFEPLSSPISWTFVPAPTSREVTLKLFCCWKNKSSKISWTPPYQILLLTPLKNRHITATRSDVTVQQAGG